MFEDFHSTASNAEGRKRKRQSLAAAVVLYGGLCGGMIAGTATATTYIEEPERTVTFVPPPPERAPESTPAPPPAVATPKVKKSRQPPVRPSPPVPKEVPDGKPEESDAELAADPDPGSEQGSVGGTAGGGDHAPPPPAPPAPPGLTKRPKPHAGNEVPRYSREARRKGIEGVVVVEVEISEAGTVRILRVVSGARELVEMVMRSLPSWRYQPAMKDGKPIRWRKTEVIRFRLEDAW
jgi:periplasmic protein TonB